MLMLRFVRILISEGFDTPDPGVHGRNAAHAGVLATGLETQTHTPEWWGVCIESGDLWAGLQTSGRDSRVVAGDPRHRGCIWASGRRLLQLLGVAEWGAGKTRTMVGMRAGGLRYGSKLRNS